MKIQIKTPPDKNIDDILKIEEIVAIEKYINSASKTESLMSQNNIDLVKKITQSLEESHQEVIKLVQALKAECKADSTNVEKAIAMAKLQIYYEHQLKPILNFICGFYPDSDEARIGINDLVNSFPFKLVPKDPI